MSEAPVPVQAVVRRVWAETPKLTGLVLEVPEAVAKGYAQPGQYVVLHTPAGKRVFLALTSAPGEAHALELLLAEQAMRDLMPHEGQSIPMEAPAGKGFPIELAKGRDVLLFAVGSAIGAMRSVVEVIRKHRTDFAKVTLYVGAHTPEELPYRAAYEAWSHDRIDVVRAASKPWVQDLFERSPVPVENATAFIVGSKQMMEDVTATLVRAGLPAERIKRNF
ncbi:hypothetical protein L6R52_35620 [Myxococcota bacterium]|nr:hypothetical protein [Myxococcota bacterium]